MGVEDRSEPSRISPTSHPGSHISPMAISDTGAHPQWYGLRPGKIGQMG